MKEAAAALSGKGISVLLADDHEVVRTGTRVVLEKTSRVRVVGECATGRETLAKARQLKPDVIVMDVWMPEMNGIEATRRIRQELPQTQVLMYSICEVEELVAQALNAGACGYVLKSDGLNKVAAAVAAARDGKPYFSPSIARMILLGYMRYAGDAPQPLLSEREREVLQLISEGHTTKEVAALLHLSLKTADTHRSNLMRKIGARSVAELVRYAVRNRVIEP